MTKKYNNSVIGKRIKEERIKLNMTQEELAEKVDVDVKFISHIERNAGLPSLGTFIKLSEALSVPVESLLSEEKNSKKKNKIITEQIENLISDLTTEQQKKIIKALKEIKSLIK